MYASMSKFKIIKGYGCFSIPKALLNDLGWNQGDLIEFCGLGDKLWMQRIHTKNELKKSEEKESIRYNKEWCKKIAVIGGDYETLGIRTFPKPLISEFNLKHNQTIYFLPAINTFL